MKNFDEEMRNLTGAYVLHALTPEEVAAFKIYLTHSGEARREVSELAATAVMLGLTSTPIQPSAGLKKVIMESILAVEQDSITTAMVVLPAEREAQARWFHKPLILLTSAAAALILIAGGVATGISYTGQQLEANNLAALVQASDSHTVSAELTAGGAATVLWSEQLASAAVLVTDTTILPAGQAYALWFISSDGTARAAGILPERQTTAWEVLDGAMHDGDSIGVTVESSTGSTQPTTSLVILISTA
jgi:anti-sigma-K factor RskA